MKRIISINELKELGLLNKRYTRLDVYDAFMMYLILNSTSPDDRIVLQDTKYMLDSYNCFQINNWMV